MAREVTSQIGSGTLPYTRQILDVDERGSTSGARGERYGTQVQVANPEDIIAVDAFMVSGVIIGTTSVQIIGPSLHTLPRTRKVIIQNVGSTDIFIGPTDSPDLLTEGLRVADSTAGEISSFEFPFLHNIEIWARAQTGTCGVRIMVY